MTTTCKARLKCHLRRLMAERPGGILSKIPTCGTGRGKAGDVEVRGLRGKCMVAKKKAEKDVLVRNTATAKNAHHLSNVRVSTAELLVVRIPGT